MPQEQVIDKALVEVRNGVYGGKWEGMVADMKASLKTATEHHDARLIAKLTRDLDLIEQMRKS